jgi:hypothetical protein
MADPKRPSTTISLADRYASQKVGGAYNAKLAGTSTDFSPQASRYDTTGNFVVDQQLGVSNFKGTTNQNYKEISLLAQGLSNYKYDPSGGPLNY